MSCPKIELNHLWYSICIKPLLFLYKFCNRDDLIQIWRTDKISMISQGRAEHTIDLFVLADLFSISGENFLFAMRVGPVRFAAGVATVILVSVIGVREAFACKDARPGIVNIDVTGIIEHVGGETARRTHIHFQGQKIVRSGLAEKFKMEESLANIERFQDTASQGFQIGRDLAQGKVVDQGVIQYRFHHPGTILQRIQKNRHSLTIGQAIKRANLTADKFLEKVVSCGFRFEEVFQIAVILEFI